MERYHVCLTKEMLDVVIENRIKLMKEGKHSSFSKAFETTLIKGIEIYNKTRRLPLLKQRGGIEFKHHLSLSYKTLQDVYLIKAEQLLSGVDVCTPVILRSLHVLGGKNNER